MGTAQAIAEQLREALNGVAVVRIGDKFDGAKEQHVSIQVIATEHLTPAANASPVVSETLLLTAWDRKSIAGAETLADGLTEFMLQLGRGVSVMDRRETAETERDGGYRGIELTYRLWRN